MEQTDKLFLLYSRYSNEQLEVIKNNPSYTDEARNTANYVIERRKEEGTYDSFSDNSSSSFASSQQQTGNYCIQQIAKDVKVIKTILLIFAIISAASALITVFSIIRLLSVI